MWSISTSFSWVKNVRCVFFACDAEQIMKQLDYNLSGVFWVYSSINVNQVPVSVTLLLLSWLERFKRDLFFSDLCGLFLPAATPFERVIPICNRWQMAERLTNKHCHFNEKHVENLRFEHIHYAHAHHNCFRFNQGVYFLTSFIPICIYHSIDVLVCFVSLFSFVAFFSFWIEWMNERKLTKNRNWVHTCMAHTSNFKMWNCGRQCDYIYCIDNETRAHM